MALRVLRLVAVASILAFGLTARAITPTYAHAGHNAAGQPLAAVHLPLTDLGEPPPTDPPLADEPPASDPPVAAEAPPSVTVGPAATDPPAVDASPTDPPVVAEPSPAASDRPSPSEPASPASTETPDPVPSPTMGDPVPSDPPPAEPAAAEPAAAEPPAINTPPTNPPVAVDPAPAASDAPDVSEPAVPASTDTADPEPSPTSGDPALLDPPAPESTSLPPSAVPSPPTVSTVPGHTVATPSTPAQTGTEQLAHASTAVPPVAHPVDSSQSVAPDWMPHVTLMIPDQLEPVAAGLVAGFAVTNRAPASVAVAIEFGRVGSGWAGAIVFNLWLSRQMRMRRMSQRQLAALSGVDHSTISRLLLHDRRPSLATATKLARALRQVEGESDTADYFERIPEETIFPSRRVEMALRADELLDDEEVRHLMGLYLDARRRRQTAMASNGRWSNGPPSAPGRIGLARAAPDRRR